jgi:hypothetical protein
MGGGYLTQPFYHMAPRQTMPYSTSDFGLNQARMALEARYHFGPSDGIDFEKLPLEKRGAFMRSQFYCALQSAMLEHVMR